MNTATKITLVRIILIPFFVATLLLAMDNPALDYLRWVALVIFVVASVSDFVDGYIARHCNQVTDFGKFLDPLADKLLVTSAFIMYVAWGRMPAWLVIIVIAREFAVTGLRMVAASNGTVLAAGWSGKIKTACTMVGLIAMMAIPTSVVLDTIVNLVILVTTIYSGTEYFVKNGKCLNITA